MKSNDIIDFSTVADVRIGPGASRELGSLLAQRGLQRVCIVTDRDIQQLGLLDEAIAGLKEQSVRHVIFSDVEPDPSDRTVERAAAFVSEQDCDGVVGLGGGSSMDVAKLVAVLAKGAQKLDALYGVDNIRSNRLPLVQIPTTAGTGSEVTTVAVVTTGETTKSGVVSRTLLADAIVLDPLLTVGLPASTTAATGIDAMVHAIEAYTSKHLKNPVSDALALSALKLLASSIHCVVKHGDDLQARSNMLLGAMQAGQAFANAPVAGVHALAYPLGGIFHVTHGLSNSLVLPHVLRFNAASADDLYQQLAHVIFQADAARVGGSADSAVARRSPGAHELADYFSQLALELGIEGRLRDVNVPQTSLNNLAEAAMLQERLLVNNPRTINQADALNIYRAAW